MNKKLYIFLAALVMVLSLSSCYDDKSTLDSLSIDEIIIESGNMPDILRVDYYGEVKFEPTVKMGAEVNPTNVTYKWEINQTPDNVSFVEIGDERVLETTITNPILSAAYTLILTVRDEKYGLEYQKSWPLFVSSAFREGIVVADTKDGQTSDLNLIMDNEITTSYDKGKFVFYNIWEQILGEKRPALIKSIDYTLHKPSALLTKNVITAIYDDKNIEMIDCEDYSLHKNKDQILPGFGSDFTPQKFQTINNAYWMLIGNNIPYVTASNQATSAFLLPVSGVKGADNAVAVADNSDGGGPFAFWYDNGTGAIYTVAMTFTTPATGAPYTNEGVFNPQAIPNKSAIAGDVSTDGITATILMRDNEEGNYELYSMSFSYYDANWNMVPSAPRQKVIFSSEINSIIDDAVSIFFNMYDPVMFVATSSRVYAISFGGGLVSHREVYSVSGGEIARAKLFVQGRYRLNRSDFNVESGPIYEQPLDLNTKAIVLAINQGSNSGVIEVIPQSSTSTGTLNLSKTLKYDGFGKILDFTFQGQ